MKINELIKQLKKIKDKTRSIHVLIGNEDNDSFIFTEIELHHTDDCEQEVEIFCNDNFMFEQDYCYSVRDFSAYLSK